ncbi:MAG: hypothetical protein K1X57_14710 [Gemmataceae bacterium]|nr:hypothetical protein [Gemmataceae bacterium]
MTSVTVDQLRAYLDDSLSDADAARVEQQLRASEPLRARLKEILAQRERGDHSVGSVWRTERLTCPTREQLGSYLLEVLEPGHQEYVEFHLKTAECPVCLANLHDLQESQKGPPASSRRKKYFETSAGLLRKR